VGDPARKKQSGRGGLQIKRIVQKGAVVKEIPHMVQDHQYHDHPAQEVDGVNALPAALKSFGLGKISIHTEVSIGFEQAFLA